MTEATVSPLVRKFKVGSVVLDDPAPDEAPSDAVQYLAAAYPVIEQCSMDDGAIDGDTLVYTLTKPAATTKGAQSAPAGAGDEDAAQALRSALVEWADRATPPEVEARELAWRRAESVLRDILRRPASVRDLDADLIPMA